MNGSIGLNELMWRNGVERKDAPTYLEKTSLFPRKYKYAITFYTILPQ